MHLLPKLSLHNLVLVSFMPNIYGNIYCENSRLKLVIHNPHYDTERKQEQGHIYQTAISHHSNKSRINKKKHKHMAIPGVLLGESHWGFPCSSNQSTVMPHSSLIPKASNFFPVLQLVWNDGVHQVLGWVKSPSRSFSSRQIWTDPSTQWMQLGLSQHWSSFPDP